MNLTKLKHSINNFLNNICNYITNKWLLNFLVTTLPGIWFLILKMVGKQFNLIDNQGFLNYHISIIFWVFIIINILYNLLISWKKSNDKKETFEGQTLLKDILSSTNSLCSKKINLLVQYIHSLKANNKKNNITSIIKPKFQIHQILDELNIILSQITSLSRDDIGLSLVYKFDFQENWNFEYFKNVKNKDLCKAVKNPNSTLNKLLNNNNDMIIELNKQNAFKNKIYIEGSRDQCLKGSILCVNLSIDYELNKYVQAVLSITTYDKPLYIENNAVLEERLKKTVILPFTTRLKLELCNYYAISKFNLCKKQNSKQNLKVIK